MSIRVMTQVWDTSEQKGSALLLLLALADHAADDGFCWPGVPLLAKKIRMSERSVIRKIKALEDAGELAVVRSQGYHNWYVVRVGMADAEVERVFVSRKLEWESVMQNPQDGRQGVYVVGGSGYYKIGHAVDLGRRISQLRAQSPFSVEAICTIECADCVELERSLHKRFSDKRTNGEWFALDWAALEYLKGLAQKDNGPDVTPDTQSPPADIATPEPMTQQCPPNLHEPSLNRQEEPPLADSPVEDSDVAFDIAETPETVEFWIEGESPPEPSPQEPVEQGKARRCRELGTDPLGVAAVVEKNRAREEHPDGGDPSKDGDPWMGRPVKEWCAFIRLPYDEQSLGRVMQLAEDLRTIATGDELHKTPDETGAAIRKMTNSGATCEWLRSAGWPTHRGFSETLINVLCGQELPEGKANGGASEGRNGRGAQVEGNGFRAMPAAKAAR